GINLSNFNFTAQDNGTSNNTSATASINVNVFAVSDKPAAAVAPSKNLPEDKSYTFNINDFLSATTSVFDPNDFAGASAIRAGGDNAKNVIITVPTKGTLVDNGQTLAGTAVVSVADISNGLLKY